MASFKVALYAITKQLAGYFIYLVMQISSVRVKVANILWETEQQLS